MHAQPAQAAPPCDRDFYPPRPALEGAFRLIKKAQVPQMSEVVLALRKEISRPEPDLERVASLLGQDPRLAGRLLQTVNAPAFNLSAKVSSIPQAVSLIGLKTLASLVTADAVGQMVSSTDGPVRLIWEAVMEQARVHVAVAQTARLAVAEDAYLFGVMQDVASLVFATFDPGYAEECLLKGIHAPCELMQCERHGMGADHPTVGFLLAGHWKLPEHIALAICHHHAGEELPFADARILQLIALSKLSRYLLALGHATSEVEDLPEMVAYREEGLYVLQLSDQAWRALCRRAEQRDW